MQKNMKSAHLSIFKTILLLTAVSGFFFASMPGALASAGNQIGKALVAAKAWVAQIDAAQYDESYAFGCGAMHDKVPQNRWALVLKTLRTPWGPVLNRNEISHVYKPNGYEGAEGEFMIITYDTSFGRMANGAAPVITREPNRRPMTARRLRRLRTQRKSTRSRTSNRSPSK